MDRSGLERKDRRQNPESGVLPDGYTEQRKHLKLVSDQAEPETGDIILASYKPTTDEDIDRSIMETNKVAREAWEKSFTDHNLPVPERKKILTLATLRKQETQLREAILQCEAAQGKPTGSGGTANNADELALLQAKLAEVTSEIESNIANRQKWEQAFAQEKKLRTTDPSVIIDSIIRQYVLADFRTDSAIERQGRRKEVYEMLKVANESQRKDLNFILVRLHQAENPSLTEEADESVHTRSYSFREKLGGLLRRKSQNSHVESSKLIKSSYLASLQESKSRPSTVEEINNLSRLRAPSDISMSGVEYLQPETDKKNTGNKTTEEPPEGPQEPTIKKLRNAIELLGEGFNRGKNPEIHMRIRESAPAQKWSKENEQTLQEIIAKLNRLKARQLEIDAELAKIEKDKDKENSAETLGAGASSIPKMNPESKVVSTINQDSFFSQPETDTYAVLDGLGGHAGGEIASQIARDIISEGMKPIDNVASLEETKTYINDLVQKAHNAIQEKVKQNPDLRGMGTTLSLTHIFTGENGDKTAVIANVGDSRVYGMDIQAIVEPLTTDDSYIQDEAMQKKFNDAVDKNQLTEEEYGMWGTRNHIKQALGVERVEVNFTIVSLKGMKKLIITSDGIHDILTTKNIRDIVSVISDPDEAARTLTHTARQENRGFRQKSEGDDMTAIVINISK